MVDAYERVWECDPQAKKKLVYEAIGIALFVGCFTYAIAVAIFTISTIVAIVSGVGIGGAALFIAWKTGRRRNRKRITRYCIQVRCTQESFEVDLTLDEKGITEIMSGLTMHFAWSGVNLLEDDGTFIRIGGPWGTMMSVPRWAFANDEARSEFYKHAMRLRTGSPGPWHRRDHYLCRCGYDLFGTEGDRCPECGSITGLPAMTNVK